MHDPVDAERFLRIVAKQADRLHAIIEDLLSLSKIEQSEDADDIALEPAPRARRARSRRRTTCQTGRAGTTISTSRSTATTSCAASINPLLLGAGRRQPAGQRHQVQRAGARSARRAADRPTAK